MQQIPNGIRFLLGNPETLENITKIKVLKTFSDEALRFLDCLSKRLMNNKTAKRYPDIVAYAFWIRRASIERIHDKYNTAQRLGRGVALHIAPSNIPVQFAVSMTYALVAGNASIIRVSNKEFPQTDLICEEIKSTLINDVPELTNYFCIIRYDHNDEITQFLSSICDVRMIWGGDATVAAIRRATISPRCLDLGFADRYSIAVIDSDGYLKKDPTVIANDFYNDTYFFDQNACSSPRLVVWIGSNIEEAKNRFWKELSALVSKKYTMEPISASDKLLRTAMCAIRYSGVREIKDDNLVVRLKIPELYEDIMQYKGNCGYFFEYDANSINSIVPILNKECQTITYVGDIEREIRGIVDNYGVRGVDRIVPMGHAGDISMVWDGMDLPICLSREVGNR